MKGYKHLTEFDRNKIARMRKEGATMREIGAALHVSAATVCREIKRGTYTYMNADYIEVTEYIPERSQARYRANMAAKGGPLKIGSDRRYAETLEALIADDNYSPEAALHEIENHPEKYGSFETRICRQTLYAYIDKGVFLRLTNKALPFKGSRRKKKTKHVQRAKQQPKGESIEKRPPEIDGRQEFGHWEMDLVVSCRGGHKCLLVLTERVTRMEVIRLIRDKRCESKRTRTYYCHPYCSSERGSNEKQNQMIRRKFPKGTNFDKVTQKDVEAVESWLNRYPRQLLGWASAGQLFEGYLQTV